jgi:hypothetical protein
MSPEQQRAACRRDEGGDRAMRWLDHESGTISTPEAATTAA